MTGFALRSTVISVFCLTWLGDKLENSYLDRGLPLVVDLDNTLVRTDTLHEALLRLIVEQPREFPGLISQLRNGKVAFKSYVSSRKLLPADGLPENEHILALIRSAREQGREVVLASASDSRQVELISKHFGVFDAAVGTGSEEAGGANLGGTGKAEILVERYGAKQFDYVGDCAVDIPVWQVAGTAYAVNPTAKLVAQARAAGVELVPVGMEEKAAWKSHVKALRPHQWVKNILVFLPMLAAQQFETFFYALMAFVLFSMTASSVYVFNDLADLPSDRVHPRKRFRPFASGAVSIRNGLVMGGGLFAASVALSLLLMPSIFSVVLIFYFAVTVAYSFSLKRKLIVDVVTLAGLYTLRIIAGGAASGIMPSPWLLAFSVFLFYSLASIKRQAELIDQKGSAPGRGYVPSDVSVMQMIAISSGQAAVLVFALYLYSPSVSELYAAPQLLWLICPVLLYWLSRIAILTHRGHMDDDPIVFAAKDKNSLLTALVVAVVVIFAERGFI